MKNKLVLWIMLLFIFIFASMSPSYGTENKSIDSDGKNAVLDLVESVPKNAAKDVELDAQIKLLFNKNVVNQTVKENNAKCFLLLDADNQVVPIDVIFPDDQMEPDRKREIMIKPKEALRENTSYRVKISPKLQSKNGTSLEKSISFSFTTVALLPEENNGVNTANQSNTTAAIDSADTNEGSAGYLMSFIWPILITIAGIFVFIAIAKAKKRTP
ncbi:MAG: Ig-like domain-containing protein [Bacillota bacterium]